MPNETVIRAEGLGKQYLIGHRAHRERYVVLRDVLARSAVRLRRNLADLMRGHHIVAGDTVEEFWALKDVDFEVKRGEVLGIIGRNGAGKSTLLKILSRITEPSEGRVSIKGRVASLLEVGTGFHPELTGRENIYLNGAILGMSHAEIRRKFDDIVAFAEVEKFLDTPVKRYSSGMYVRLAFAVAAHLDPEILVVDEVLAVGDAEFQKKCLGKMDEVSRREGRTVLFVSHNMGVISSLCSNVVWLDHGVIVERGEASRVVMNYLSQGSITDKVIDLEQAKRPYYVQESRVRVSALEWLCPLPLRHGEPIKARIHFQAYARVPEICWGIGFSENEGRPLLCYVTDFKDGCRPDISGPGSFSVDIAADSLPLCPQVYLVEVGARSGGFHGLDYLPAASSVEVIAGPNTPTVQIPHGVTLECAYQWRIDKNCVENPVVTN